MTILKAEPIDWSVQRTAEGHRNYTYTWLIETNSINDGPATILTAAGLPSIGSQWVYGNDSDLWAFYTGEATVRRAPTATDPGIRVWHAGLKFSTVPRQRCQDGTIEDPLQEPDRVSGNSVRYTRKATRDRFDRPIKSSSHEIFTGPEVEFDANRHSVVVEQNVANLELGLANALVDVVNSVPMWGVPKRRVKLSDFNWSRVLYGTCNFYFVRRFSFDIVKDSITFDRLLIDEGHKLLNGHWDTNTSNWVLDDIDGSPPNPENPTHFVRAKDPTGENTKFLLNGVGEPITNISGELETGTGASSPVAIPIEYYPEYDLFSLGLPTDLETV